MKSTIFMIFIKSRHNLLSKYGKFIWNINNDIIYQLYVNLKLIHSLKQFQNTRVCFLRMLIVYGQISLSLTVIIAVTALQSSVY